MEEDKLKDIFEGFNPELTSDSLFMSRLRRGMEAVEIVRERQAELRRRGSRAVVVAAITGFAVGILLSLMLPWLGDFVSRLSFNVPGGEAVSLNWTVIGWGIIGLASVLTSLNAYTITLTRHKP